MENSKRSAEEAFNGSASSCQRIHHQEGATCDAPVVLEQRADPTQPLAKRPDFHEVKFTESKCNKTVVDHITQILVEYHIHTT